MSKISKQMGNRTLDMDIMKKVFGVTATFSILRDITYRSLYIYLVNDFTARFMKASKYYD